MYNLLLEQGLEDSGQRIDINLNKPIVLVQMFLVPFVQKGNKILICQGPEILDRFRTSYSGLCHQCSMP